MTHFTLAHAIPERCPVHGEAMYFVVRNDDVKIVNAIFPCGVKWVVRAELVLDKLDGA